MKRRIFTLLSAGSLVLWLAVAVLFVRSFWVEDICTGSQWDGVTEKDALVWSSGGRFGYQRVREEIREPERIAERSIAAQNGWDRWRYELSAYGTANAKWYRSEYITGLVGGHASRQFMLVTIPYWPFLLLLTMLPTLWLRRFRRERRQGRWEHQGFCRECGYDLRASEGKCPECGLAIPADLVRKPIS